jgi:hypothetical protein
LFGQLTENVEIILSDRRISPLDSIPMVARWLAAPARTDFETTRHILVRGKARYMVII